MSNCIHRNMLNEQKILSEYRAILGKNIDKALLVTGKHKSKVEIDYFRYFRLYVTLVRQAFS